MEYDANALVDKLRISSFTTPIVQIKDKNIVNNHKIVILLNLKFLLKRKYINIKNNTHG